MHRNTRYEFSFHELFFLATSFFVRYAWNPSQHFVALGRKWLFLVALTGGETMVALDTNARTGPAGSELVRSIDWRGAFWVASGVPALVLFSIGGIAGTSGNVAFLVWMASM